MEQFHAVSFYKEAVEGRWRQADVLYRDDLALIVVDVADTAKNRKWMKAYKAKWKVKLDQLELWMISYPIDIESNAGRHHERHGRDGIPVARACV